MSDQSVSPPAVCIAGPTGAGKSALALYLAACFDGEIINADSRQVYRDFPILTAQPPADEQQRCPHRLYGFLETHERISAGRWAAMAADSMHEVSASGRLPIVIGGTGLYLRALFDGMADIPPVPTPISERLLAEWNASDPAAMHARLTLVDPACAARIHPNDRQRTLRALEVHEATGRPLSWWQTNRPQAAAPWRVLRLGVGLPLAELTPLLERRIACMLEAGALREARTALLRCADGQAPGWSGIGCAELFAYLHDKLDDLGLRRDWLANTRAYAKRQLTWFRADTRLLWHTPGETNQPGKKVRDFLRM